MTLPRFHVVTDDAVLARPDFPALARELLAAHGAAIALHLRGRATPARRLFSLAEKLVRASAASGATVLVNDRIDVSLAAGAHGVHLGERSIAPADARTLLTGRLLGRSIHTPAGIVAVARWTDFVFLGTIYPTPSHPDASALGPAAIAEAAAAVELPVLGIGGITPDHVTPLLNAGAYGVAVIRGVWAAADPAAAVVRYLDALR